MAGYKCILVSQFSLFCIADRRMSLYFTLGPAKTDEPIEMPFGLRTPVGPSNHVLDEGPDAPMGRDNFEGERDGQL